MVPLILLQKVSKVYSQGATAVHALRDVSFRIGAGEFVAIMGASGSGKSTLMNILGCLDQPTSGTYLLDGRPVGGLHRDDLAEIRARKIGFVFQQFNLLPRTDALDNIKLPLLYSSNLTRDEEDRRATELLRAVGLEGREHHTPAQLSGGQQQRVAIARALVNNPQILLADEPTGALDSRTSVEVMDIFQRLNRERGITVLLVTHEADVAAFAGRVIHMRDGHIDSDVAQEPVLAVSTLTPSAIAEGEPV